MTTDQLRERDKLPPLERAVSDTLDEYMIRIHGIMSSWASPCEFIQLLNNRGYIIHAKDQGEVAVAE